jgi:light-regulated signal transduction histidine kinase (bacteriophytochrome)
MHSSFMLTDAQESCAEAEDSDDVPDELERLRLENEALRSRVAALSRSNADLEQFAWSASHDLKEPLRTVAAYTQLLLRRKPPVPGSEEAEFAAFVQSGIDRLHEMIDGLLAYARANQGEQQLHFCDTGAIVEDAIEALQGLMTERGASVSLTPLPPVAAPPTPVLQIFSNLIGNALKYTVEAVPPRIEIFAAREDAADAGMVQFAVRDNGIGIDAQYLDRIFEPFQRLHGDEYPGIGLGLALSKRLVERHGGRIWVECNPGSGSTFCFTLPAARAGAARATGIL